MLKELNEPENFPDHAVPLESGEHPWAKRLKKSRRMLNAGEWGAELALSLVLIATAFPTSFSNLLGVAISSVWLVAGVYCALLASLYGLVGLPFGIARWRIDRRFGLSVQSLRMWIWDRIKGAFVGGIIGAFVVEGLAAILLSCGSAWWWISALAMAFFGIVLTRLAPQIIVPLFFKMRPLASPELRERFIRLAQRTGTPVLGVFTIDMSRKTRAANAAVIGFGKSRRAVVGDTLLENFTVDEVEFVLAHELGHHKYHDLWTGMAVGVALELLTLATVHIVLSRQAIDGVILLPVRGGVLHFEVFFWIALVASAVGLVLSPLSRLFSRQIETRADMFAAHATGHAKAGVSAFRRLGYRNMAVFRPPRWEETLFFTHPSIARRISMLGRLAN